MCALTGSDLSPPGGDTTGYWQQRADYVIRVSLDTVRHTVTGEERITYTNNSPDTLRAWALAWDDGDGNADLCRPALLDDPATFVLAAHSVDGRLVAVLPEQDRIERTAHQPGRAHATRRSAVSIRCMNPPACFHSLRKSNHFHRIRPHEMSENMARMMRISWVEIVP